MSALYYTGIGSRETPPDVLELMTAIARRLSEEGWTLRSGAAPGADQAFERGATRKEIYLPWPGFERRSLSEKGLYLWPPQAMVIAAGHHPLWGKLTQGMRRIMARNVCQVLGYDLVSPSRFVLCWTPDGCQDGRTSRRTGGTGMAIRLAACHEIPIHNLQRAAVRRQWEDWLASP